MSVPEEGNDGGRVGRSQQRFAEWSLGKTLGKLGKNLQMLLGRLFWHQQHKQQIDRATVRRIEGNRCRQTQEGTGSLLEPLDATVRNRDTLAKTGGTEFFAGEQAVENDGTGQPEMTLEKHAGLLEDALLAAGIQVKHHL